jgi:hypothetical protein
VLTFLIQLTYDDSIEMKTTMGNDSLCEILPEIIKTYSEDSTIVSNACRVIYNLALCYATRVKLDNAGACQALLTVMRNYCDNVAVLIHAYKAMSELFNVSSATATRLLQAGVHTTVTSAITHHMSNADLVINGTSVLNWLSHHSTTQMKTTMGIDGVCQILPDVIRAHINN